ncbi:phage baseplate assembly protein V [Chryseobacterium sp. Ch-15]|uniref:Phage baseplate assembly protein V n=1 Tax=Chryseobacterium muglaense TaxID=2893752 RepID=A0A9Q3UZ24_9FLAO|nr:phage baseplate assembly protein V [Chryseobacterium muglaense]MBD3906718.1 Vgr family protein [Chryseobacterium muglaense]MCC9036618.1 phage baseplate assembly protein V [Chryseobacterium muglaense]MCM2556488.1 phage baseplate assembly protein V [Chryseobacterium muglaense]
MRKDTTNAEKISENHIAGIQRVVSLEIVIDGKIIKHFKHFQLEQSVRKHHHFKLTLAHDSLDEIQNHNLLEAQNFLGKRITVIFRYKDAENESPETTFVGVITKVAYSQEKMSLGNVILKGFSPTILMDSAPHTQSFGGNQAVNTSIIAESIIKETISSGKFDYKINTQNRSYINYSVQYKETHYNYLTRLAEAYGEQFYYDGETLYFGKLPPKGRAIRLTYGSNVNDICVELKAVHIKPEFFAYHSSDNAKLQSSTAEIKHLGQLAEDAYRINNEIYTTHSLISSPINANLSIDLDDSQKSAAGSAAVEVFTVSGTTSVPFLYPGCIADIEMRKPDSNQTTYFTKLLITEVSHEVNTRGFYTGSFEAIAEGTGFLPKSEFTIPIAEPQIATVISNIDPLNQGRIQVRFDWQLNDSTHFIRMMSPDAGGTDAITQNRGFVAVPEVGDQVMVGFEYHHPDFPFAMGGMFHGLVGLGGGVNNHMRSIQTKSGIKVLMNDDEKSVTILDPSGNTYFMDGNGNITVTAPKNMTFNVGENMNINVGKDMKTSVGNDNSIDITNNHQFNSKNYKQTINENKTINIEGDLNETTSTTTHKAKNGDILLQSSGVAKMLGKIDAKVNKG